jgi:histidinol-phosphate aminotransferase
MTTMPSLLPLVATARGYAPVRHPAPCDLDLSGTELPPVDPSLVARALAGAAGLVGRYPSTATLAERLADRHGVAVDRVLVTDGTDDALERAFRVTLAPGRRVVLTSPTFEMLPRYARLTGAELLEVPWPDERFPLGALQMALADARGAVAIVSPNNPTGAVATGEELRQLASAAPEVLVIVDQAYIEFADDDPMPGLLDLPNLLFTRTFSKAWGLPGLRIGAAIGAAPVIDAMRRVAPPYAVSVASLEVALAVLDAGDGPILQRAAELAVRRERLFDTLATLGTDPVHSQADFVATASPRAPWLRDALAGLGIAVRWLPTAPSGGRMRIAAPWRAEDADRLDSALETAAAPQAILLDMDGVLADVSESYDAAIVATAATWGVVLTDAEIAARKADGDANDDWALTRDLLQRHGVSASLQEVTDRFEICYQGTDGTPGLRERECPIPEVDLLRRLAARLPLGIVTGRPRDDAARFLDRYALSDCFQAVVTREDAPQKPDPAPVQLALRRLGVERAWMVGDTPDDIRAARAAGVVPIGVIPPGTPRDPLTDVLRSCGAARVLTSLDEILQWLP